VAAKSLFVYGTLTSQELVGTLTGRRFPSCPATLEGYARVFPEALGGFPNIVPRAGEVVTGLLLENIDAASLGALDAYEDTGRLYCRHPVEVVARGVRVWCEVYLARHIPALTGTP